MNYETNFDLDTDAGLLEGVPMLFEVDVETYPAEHYSWGGSRGDETEVNAKFMSLQLNELTLHEDEVRAWLGPNYIHHLETQVEETLSVGG